MAVRRSPFAERIAIGVASAALFVAAGRILHARGGPFIDKPATIVEHVSTDKHNTRDALLLLPRVRPLIPRGAKVTCFRPQNGKWTYDIAAFSAAVGQLPHQKVEPPFTAGEDSPPQDLAEYVVAVNEPFTHPSYRLVAEFPEGRLYKVQR